MTAMSIDWTKPLVVAGTDRAATVVGYNRNVNCHGVRADWEDDGQAYLLWLFPDGTIEDSVHCQVTNAPSTPQIGPEHIEALAEAIEEATQDAIDAAALVKWGRDNPSYASSIADRAEAAEQRAARLAEIRAYLESL